MGTRGMGEWGPVGEGAREEWGPEARTEWEPEARGGIGTRG